MTKPLLRTSVLVFWLVMTAWLVRYEAFPGLFTHALSGYKSVLSEDVLLEDSWMRILFDGAPIGYSHSSVEIDENNPEGRYIASGSIHLKLRILGTEQNLHVDTGATIDMFFKLQHFTFKLYSDAYTMLLRGMRARGQTFNISMNTGNSSQKLRMEIPDDVIIYSPMTDMAVQKLKPGQELTLKTLDPTSMSTVIVAVRALRKEKILLGGEEYESTVLSSEYGGGTVLSWIDEEGLTLRQETPFGWVLERCEADEAFAALKEAGSAEDVIARLAVDCVGEIRNPRRTPGLRLRLKGGALEPEQLRTHRQTVESAGGNEAVVIVKAETFLKRQGDVGSAHDGSFSKYLAATTFLQSDHPDIVAQAKRIVGGETDPAAKAEAVYEWVHRNVRKEVTVSLPSALDVLKTRAGDCNEHTYLFVGLARAAGVPSKIMVGLAFQDGAFYYHAWPAVYVGRWVEMDPTWGQEAVDATHIALLEGGPAAQIELMKVLGRLEIELIEEIPVETARAGPAKGTAPAGVIENSAANR